MPISDYIAQASTVVATGFVARITGLWNRLRGNTVEGHRFEGWK